MPPLTSWRQAHPPPQQHADSHGPRSLHRHEHSPPTPPTSSGLSLCGSERLDLLGSASLCCARLSRPFDLLRGSLLVLALRFGGWHLLSPSCRNLESKAPSRNLPVFAIYIYIMYMMMMMMLNLVYKGLGNSLTLGGCPLLRRQPDLHHLHTQYIDSTLSPSRLRLPDFQLIVPESKQHSNMPVLAPPSMQPTPLLLHHNPSWFLQWCQLCMYTSW